MIFGIKADKATDRGYRVICIFKMLDSNVDPYGIQKTNGSFAKLTSEKMVESGLADTAFF